MVFTTITYAETKQKIDAETLLVGPNSGTTKKILLNDGSGYSSPGFRWNSGTSQVEFSHDGSTWFALGSSTGAPNTIAGFDPSGNLYDLPTWTFDPDVNSIASIMTTDGASYTNKERFLINTNFGDGVSGDMDNFHDIYISDTTNANYDILNYKTFYSNFNQANGATVTNATLLDNNYGGDLTGNFVGINNSYSGTATNITHVQLNLSGDTSTGFLGINQQYNFDSIGGTVHEMSYNGTNTGSLFGSRVDANGSSQNVSGFTSVIQGTVTNQLEQVSLSSNATIGGNAFFVNANNQGDIAGQLNGFNGSNSGELTLGGTFVNVFNTGDSLGYLNGFAFSNSGNVTGNFQGAYAQNSGSADNFSGFNTNNSGVITANSNHVQLNDNSNSPTADVTGVQVNFTGTYDEVYGINSNVSSATSSTGKRKVSGTFIGENFNTFSQFSTVSSLPTVVDSGNGITSYFLVAPGSPITDTSVIMNNLSGLVDIQDDFSGDPFYNLGLGMVGYVGQVSAASGKTASELSMAIAGGSVPATSTGGTISKTNMYLAAGLLPGGGTITAPEINGFRSRSDMCQLSTGTCYGLTIEDANADNYVAKSLKVGGSKGTLNSSTALHLADKKALLFTPMTTAEKNALTAVESMIVYDDTLGEFNYYDGSAWQSMGGGGGAISSVNGETGPAITIASGTTGTDVNVTAATNTVTIHVPTASATNTGKLSSSDWSTFNAKVAGPASSVDGEIALFDSTTGKLIKRATGTGFVKATSGVYSTTSTVNAATELTGVAPLANGGTNKNMTAVAGGAVYTDSDSMEVTAAGTSGQFLRSNGTSAPTWDDARSLSQSYAIYQANNSLLDRLVELEYNLGTVNVIDSKGSGLFTVTDDGGNTRTVWTASKKISMTLCASARPTTANRPIQIRLNGGGQAIGVGSQNSASDPTHVCATVIMNPSDYLSVFVGTYDGTSGDSVPNDGNYFYTTASAIEVR